MEEIKKGSVFIVKKVEGDRVEMEAVNLKETVRSGPKWKPKEPKVK
jgi:hypothetical protein